MYLYLDCIKFVTKIWLATKKAELLKSQEDEPLIIAFISLAEPHATIHFGFPTSSNITSAYFYFFHFLRSLNKEVGWSVISRGSYCSVAEQSESFADRRGGYKPQVNRDKASVHSVGDFYKI